MNRLLGLAAIAALVLVGCGGEAAASGRPRMPFSRPH